MTADGREQLAAGGWTWEALSAKYGKLDAAFWEAMIPNMGIFALVRNLRNFDDAGISKTASEAVISKITDADVVAASRMFPLRFYSAYANTGSSNWSSALDTALNLSLSNVPVLKGKTLVLVDMSGSMNAPLSERSKISRDKAAAVFGAALAIRAENADLVEFGTGSKGIAFRKGDSILRTVEKFTPMGGTETMQAIMQHYKDHDRIVILTDEQAFSWGQSGALFLAYGIGAQSVSALKQIDDIPATIYTFNLAGYKAGHMASGPKRHTFGGLSDAGFTALALLERGKDADWPF